ncbi:hypothetical protein SESBI_08938 [Sesbania bispinosa]|nr:hypothetical protein SESBI_08938 [Sesbania bispinosa]
MVFCIAYYHMNSFVNEPRLHCEAREIHVFHGLEMDTWSYFEALGLTKDLGYVDKVKMWWKEKGTPFDRGLKPLAEDDDALELANVAEIEGSCVLNVIVSEQPDCGGSDLTRVRQSIYENIDEKGDSTDDDSVKDVHFDDSEEERDLGIDDRFNMPEIGEAETTLNEQVQNIKSVVNEGGNVGGLVPVELVVNEGGSAGGNVAAQTVVNEGGSSGGSETANVDVFPDATKIPSPPLLAAIDDDETNNIRVLGFSF